MHARTFQFQLQSSPGAAANGPSLQVERLSDEGAWEVQEPSLNTPPSACS